MTAGHGSSQRIPARCGKTLAELDSDGRQALFAHCVGLTVNAVYLPYDRRPKALRHADRLATAVTLDTVAAGWVPTVDGDLGRVTKARILEAVREAKGAASRPRQGVWGHVAGETKEQLILVLDRQSEGPGVPAELGQRRNPVGLSQARHLADAVLEAVLQDGGLDGAGGPARATLAAPGRRDKDARPVVDVRAPRHTAAGHGVRENLGEEMGLQGGTEPGPAGNTVPWLDAEEVDRVFGIKLIDLARVRLAQRRPAQFVNEDAVTQAEVLLDRSRVEVSVLLEDDVNRKHRGIPFWHLCRKENSAHGCSGIPGFGD